MIVFDDVEIPWENVFFYRHTKAAAFIRATLHRYSIFPYVQRYLRFADFLLGVAYASARSTGVTMHQAVREKIAQIACYREGINAHLTAAIELAEPEPGRAADAQSADDVRRPGIRLHPAAGGHAPRPRPVRLPGQPDAQQGHVRQSRRRRLAAEVLHLSGDPGEERRKLFALARTCSTPTTPGTG
jgi:Aromatic ring hydroxylase